MLHILISLVLLSYQDRVAHKALGCSLKSEWGMRGRDGGNHHSVQSGHIEHFLRFGEDPLSHQLSALPTYHPE